LCVSARLSTQRLAGRDHDEASIIDAGHQLSSIQFETAEASQETPASEFVKFEVCAA
jgi:hypothetical protein